MTVERWEEKFRGRWEHTIDDKGRVSLPVKWREILQKKFDGTIIITNYDRGILAYPAEEWVKVEEKILSRPPKNRKERDYQRFLVSGATECSLDKQGRILIPPSLKNYAHLGKNVVFAGKYDHFEIWNDERFGQIISDAKEYEESEEINEIIHDIGL
jgi:MraZ protein